jgi:hypothetical protein
MFDMLAVQPRVEYFSFILKKKVVHNCWKGVTLLWTL